MEMEARLRSRNGGAERVLLSIVEFTVADVVLAAGKSLLWILSAVNALAHNADASLIVDEIIKGNPVATRGDSKAESVPEDKDSDSDDDGEEDDDDQEDQDDEGEDYSGDEGQDSDGAEDEDPEANGEGGSDDDDDEDGDDDDDDDDEDDEDDDEDDDEEDTPQPPAKKRK